MSADEVAAHMPSPDAFPTGESAGGDYIYVVDLDPAVMQNGKFAGKNPQYIEGEPCVYIGMTGLTPEERFRNHMRGHRASKYVKRYGKHLREDLSEGPMPRAKAEEREPELAAELRAKGWAVWQN